MPSKAYQLNPKADAPEFRGEGDTLAKEVYNIVRRSKKPVTVSKVREKNSTDGTSVAHTLKRLESKGYLKQVAI